MTGEMQNSAIQKPIFSDPNLNVLAEFMMQGFKMLQEGFNSQREYLEEEFRIIGIRFEHVDNDLAIVAEVLQAHSQKLNEHSETLEVIQTDLKNVKDTVSAHTDLHREHERNFKILNRKLDKKVDKNFPRTSPGFVI